jgi:hypothetical protein
VFEIIAEPNRPAILSLPVSSQQSVGADAPKVLECNWGGFDMRWQLEALGGGTRLTLWTNIDRRFISMGAAGWHLFGCSGSPSQRDSHRPHRRPEAMKFGGGRAAPKS